MDTYAINFKHDNSTITVEAEYFDIKDGFVRLYKKFTTGEDVFAIYDASNVRHCVLQKKYTQDEIIEQMKTLTAKESM